MNNYNLLNWIIVISIIAFICIIRHYKKNNKNENIEKEDIGRDNTEQEPKIYLTEKYIGIDNPIAIHGYPDRVIWKKESPNDKQEKLIIEDLKNRNYFKVFETDIIQLSVLKYILKRVQKDGEVSEKARIHIKTPNGTKIKYIDLYSDEKVEEIYNRYQLLNKGDVIPKQINNINFCIKCPHYQKYCYPEIKNKGDYSGKRKY